MEIGSFLELQFSRGQEFYNQTTNIARLNTGRMGIWHAFRITGAKRIWLPIYQCDSIRETFKLKGIDIKYYHQDKNFNPIDISAEENDAVLLVNYYGIMSDQRMQELSKNYKNPIIDNCQAFFCTPIKNAINVYSCRKFIGVPDGAYVIGKNAHLYVQEYPQCYSSDTANFLLTRIEYGCEGKGYKTREINERRIDSEGCMKMSKLTHTILDGTNYEYIKTKRRENFKLAAELLNDINKIDPLAYYNDDTIPMVYPLVIENDELITHLFTAKHFQGHWWSYICNEQPKESFEHWISRYVIPITIDQRYGKNEIEYLNQIIRNKYANRF